jgi:hypothetical protein
MSDGPNLGRRVDIDTMTKELFEELHWDHETAIPSFDRLEILGLEELA